MKSFATVTVAIVLVVAATVQGFTPSSRQLVPGGRVGGTSTELQKSIFDAISDMDLWAPDKDANTYGARKKKKLGIGDIKAGKSYVPDGLTAAQYQELRKKQETSKKDNYQRNMSKRNTHGRYYEFYKDRGTDLNADWAKNKNTLGHTFAKTKYDWQGKEGRSFTGSNSEEDPDKIKNKKKSSWGRIRK